MQKMNLTTPPHATVRRSRSRRSARALALFMAAGLCVNTGAQTVLPPQAELAGALGKAAPLHIEKLMKGPESVWDQVAEAKRFSKPFSGKHSRTTPLLSGFGLMRMSVKPACSSICSRFAICAAPDAQRA